MKFAYLCGKTFDQLPGRDPLVRRCPECSIDVLDFDRLTDEERAEYLALQGRIGEPPCVTTRAISGVDTASCKQHPSVLSAHLTGRVALPVSGEAFRQELSAHPSAIAELQRRYAEVAPRRQALLELARRRAREE